MFPPTTSLDVAAGTQLSAMAAATLSHPLAGSAYVGDVLPAPSPVTQDAVTDQDRGLRRDLLQELLRALATQKTERLAVGPD
jgi:hypothetical protein